jgi:solute carrier family 25 protein 39/40
MGHGISGTLDGIVKIGRNEGIRSLYRGLVPTMIMSVPATVVYFVGYESLKDRLSSEQKFSIPSALVPTVSGGVARIFAATVVSPVELIKTGMQHRGQNIVSQVSDLVKVVRFAGVGVLFKGLVPTLWRDVPFSGIYWTGYEMLKGKFSPQYNPSPLQDFTSSFLAGSLSGAIAATLTIPFDVIKTRKQVDLHAGIAMAPSSLLDQLLHIYRTEGISGMTRGIVPRVAKVSPACAIMISSYEVSKRLLHDSKLSVDQ